MRKIKLSRLLLLLALYFADAAGYTNMRVRTLPVLKDTTGRYKPNIRKADDSLTLPKETGYFYFLMYS